MEEFWQTCSAQLEMELTPQQYSAWIKPLVVLDYEDGKVRIAAPNRFKLDWVKTQFASRITALAAEFWEMPVDVQFVLDPRTMKKAPAPGAPAVHTNNGDGGQRAQAGPCDGPAPLAAGRQGAERAPQQRARAEQVAGARQQALLQAH